MSQIVFQIIRDSMIERNIEPTDKAIALELYIVKRHINNRHSHHMDSIYSKIQINQLEIELRKK